MVKREKKITALFLILSSLMIFCGRNVFADYQYEPIEDCIAAVNGINNSGTEYYQLSEKELMAVERVLEYDNERSVNGSQNVTGIKFNETRIIMAVGDTSDALIATLTPQNGLGGRLTWHSSDTSVITVDQNGRITAEGTGNAAAFAESENGIITACGVYVLPYKAMSERLKLSSKAYEYEVGSTFFINADYSGYYSPSEVISWSVSGTSEMICSPAAYTYACPYGTFVYKGKSQTYTYKTSTIRGCNAYTASKPGTVVITGKAANGAQDSVTVTIKPKDTSVTVSPSTASLKVGGSLSLTAEVSPANAFNRSVTWSSSNESIAAVDQNGRITGISAGTAIITAVSSNGYKATCTVTVNKNTDPTQIQMYLNSNNTMKPGESKTLTVQILPSEAAGTPLTFSSSNPSVAAVSSTGRVTAYSVGLTVITATAPNGISKSITVKVEKESLIASDHIYVKAGETVPIIYSCSPSDTTFTYELTNENYSGCFSVNTANKTITGISPVSTTIRLKASNGLTKNINITVLDKTISSASYLRLPSVYNKEVNDKFAVEVTCDIKSNTRHQTWISTDPTVASVNNGIVTCRQEGTAKIICRVPGGRTAETTVNVGPASSHPASVITLKSEETVYVETGEYLDLSYTVSPSSEAAYVSVYSDKQSAVSVQGNRVYGKTFGMATVYIKPKNGTEIAVTVCVNPPESVIKAAMDQYAADILYYVNLERSKAGVPALTTHSELIALAQIRAVECTVQYSHTRPDGEQWYTVFKDYSHKTTSKGENLISGKGYTPAEYVEGWMNSPSHRENILQEKYNTTGIGVVPYINYYDNTISARYAAQLFTAE